LPDLTSVINSSWVVADENGDLGGQSMVLWSSQDIHKGTHFVYEAPKTPDVRLGVVTILGQDLRWHVQRCLSDEHRYIASKLRLTPTYVSVKAEVPISLLNPKSPSLTWSSDKNTAC
jgi:hypothetical protein